MRGSSTILTDYDFDFDCITELKNFDAGATREHIRKNREILRALEQTSDFLGMVLNFAVNIIGRPVFGWIKMGIKLINFLKNANFKVEAITFPDFSNIAPRA